jgi:hypothetical protein
MSALQSVQAKNNFRIEPEALDWETALKLNEPQSAKTIYTLQLYGRTGVIASNLILEVEEEQSSAYLLEFEADPDWLKNTVEPTILNFTGIIRKFDLEGRLLNETMLKKGSTTNSSARMQEFCDYTLTAVTAPDYPELGVEYTLEIDCPPGTVKSGGSPGTSDGGSTGDDSSGGSKIGVLISSAELWEQAKISDREAPPCIQKVVDELTSLTQGIGWIIQKFAGENPNFDWRIVEGDLGDYQNAMTTTSLTEGYAVSTFDVDKFSSASDLSVARTMLHESVHAYLVSSSFADRLGFQSDYPTLMSEYNNGKEPNDAHHTEMVVSFIEDIAISLEQYGNLKGYSYDREFYRKLAWGGLESTQAFQEKSSQEKEEINDLIRIELTGKDSNGNDQDQKGQKAGC